MFGFPSIVRFSWSTARQLLHDKAHAVTWHDSLDDEQTATSAGERGRADATSQRLDRFLAATSHSTIGHGGSRCQYFQQRRIGLLTSLA